jgi:hypothetical protein
LPNKTPSFEIPVIADSLCRDVDDANRLARCVFLNVVADEPEAGQDLLRKGQQIPFVMIALQGILHQPLGAATEFTSTDQIGSLIVAIEGPTAEGPFTVETGVVWVPARWLDAACRLQPQKSAAERGDVFRVALSLFPRSLASG